MIIRLYFKKFGGHYHCRVFTGMAKNMTFAKSGDLVRDEREWDTVRTVLNSACEFIEDLPSPAIDFDHIGGM